MANSLKQRGELLWWLGGSLIALGIIYLLIVRSPKGIGFVHRWFGWKIPKGREFTESDLIVKGVGAILAGLFSLFLAWHMR